MVTREERQSFLESLFSVTIILLDQVFGSLLEKTQYFLVDFGQLFGGLLKRGFDQVVRLGHANLLELDSCLILDLLNLHLVLVRVKGDASSGATCSRGSTRPMNVRFRLFWRFNLNDEVDTGNVQASRSDISRHQNAKLFLLESLEGHFALRLWNITVHNFDVIPNFFGEKQLVRILFSRSEHDGLTAAIAH